MLAALGPVSVARRSGHDWKSLSRGERKLVSDVTRCLHRQHSDLISELEIRIFDQSSPGEPDYELARAMAGIADFDEPARRRDRVVWLTKARNTLDRLRHRDLDVRSRHGEA